jgi:choline dehydrogenase-like flavoprotein
LQAGYSDALQFLNKRLISDFDVENEFRLQIKEIAPFPELVLRIHKFAETEVWQNSLENLIVKHNFHLRLESFVAEILPASEFKKATLTVVSNHHRMDEEFDFIVVTAGTFQSTALILRSEKLQIPNRSILGSGLMEHIEGVVGHITVHSQKKKEFFRKVVLNNNFCFTEKNYGGGFYLRNSKITYHVEFVPLQQNFIPPGTRLIFTKFRNFGSKIRIYLEKKVLRADHYSLNLKAEEFMNADSKLYLDETKEKLIVDHKISKPTLQAIRLELVKFQNYLEENRIGKCFLDARVYGHLKNSGLNPNWHPMGTTRLGRHEDSSILDENLALHRHKNIFVASASVFPTGSDGNPTFTTMALTFRLSKHLLALAK